MTLVFRLTEGRTRAASLLRQHADDSDSNRVTGSSRNAHRSLPIRLNGRRLVPYPGCMRQDLMTRPSPSDTVALPRETTANGHGRETTRADRQVTFLTVCNYQFYKNVKGRFNVRNMLKHEEAMSCNGIHLTA